MSIIRITEPLTPAPLEGPTHNFAPPGFPGISRIRLMPEAAGTTITGLVAGEDGALLLMTNLGVAAQSVIRLRHDDPDSDAANRFYCPNGVQYNMARYESVFLIYSTDVERWLVLGGGV